MTFELVGRPYSRGGKDRPFVSIDDNKQLYLSSRFVAKYNLEKHRYAEVYYDHTSKSVGLIFHTTTTENCVHLVCYGSARKLSLYGLHYILDIQTPDDRVIITDFAKRKNMITFKYPQ